MFTFRIKAIAILFVVIAAIVFTGCQASQANGPKISISSVWGRPSPMMKGSGAVYLVIENKGNQNDRLIGASTTAASAAEVHESLMDNNVMKMRPVEGGLEIPANGKVELKPNSYHIMLINLVNPLKAGDKITVNLKFEKSGEMPVIAEVREQ